MEQKIRDISLFWNPEEASYTYWLYGEVDYQGIGGQGDVEHDWTFFCVNKDNLPVLIREHYDIPWNRNGCGPESITSHHLCGISEEILSYDEATRYFTRFYQTKPKAVTIPIELTLQGKPL